MLKIPIPLYRRRSRHASSHTLYDAVRLGSPLHIFGFVTRDLKHGWQTFVWHVGATGRLTLSTVKTLRATGVTFVRYVVIAIGPIPESSLVRAALPDSYTGKAVLFFDDVSELVLFLTGISSEVEQA